MKNECMKNVDEMGLTNMSQEEMKQTNGGTIILTILTGLVLYNLGSNIGKSIRGLFSEGSGILNFFKRKPESV